MNITEREKEVLKNLAIFGDFAKTSQILFISPRTVESHLRLIRRKTQSKSSLEAIALFFDQLNIQQIKSRPCFVTPTEFKILSLVASGKSNRDIAEALKVSKRTIESHKYNLFLKTDLKAEYQLLTCFRLHPERFDSPRPLKYSKYSAIKELKSSGLSTKQVVERLGTCKSYVYAVK